MLSFVILVAVFAFLLYAIEERIAADKTLVEQWDARELAADDGKALAQRDQAKAGLSQRLSNLALAREFVSGGGDLSSRMKKSRDRYRQWRSAAAARVAQIREHILSHDLDTPLPQQDWEAIRSTLDHDRGTYWALGYRELSDATPMHVETSLLTLGAKGLEASRVQIAADYYAASPEKRSLVPPTLIDAMEPYWRRLYANRPHRMGGIHDGIQSDPRVGPAREVLLFQIVSDRAMHWTWGDAGAYYVFIDTDRLAKNDFTSLKAFFENH